MFFLEDTPILSQPDASSLQSIEQIAEHSTLSVFADWFTIIGLLLTGLGLYYTFLQVNKTKKAAEAAEESAIKTAEKLESFQFAASLAMNIEKLKTCHTLLKENKWDEVARHLTDAKEQVIILRESLDQNSEDPAIKDELISLNDLRTALNHDIMELHNKSHDNLYPVNLELFYRHINDIHEFFIAKQTQIIKK